MDLVPSDTTETEGTTTTSEEIDPDWSSALVLTGLGALAAGIGA